MKAIPITGGHCVFDEKTLTATIVQQDRVVESIQMIVLRKEDLLMLTKAATEAIKEHDGGNDDKSSIVGRLRDIRTNYLSSGLLNQNTGMVVHLPGNQMDQLYNEAGQMLVSGKDSSIRKIPDVPVDPMYVLFGDIFIYSSITTCDDMTTTVIQLLKKPM